MVGNGRWLSGRVSIQRKDARPRPCDPNMPVLVCVPPNTFRAPRHPRKSGPEGLNACPTFPGVSRYIYINPPDRNRMESCINHEAEMRTHLLRFTSTRGVASDDLETRDGRSRWCSRQRYVSWMIRNTFCPEGRSNIIPGSLYRNEAHYAVSCSICAHRSLYSFTQFLTPLGDISTQSNCRLNSRLTGSSSLSCTLRTLPSS